LGRGRHRWFSDDKQRLCFCLGLWNGKDPILKERLFGLTNSEGNHGEDVKEYYFYVDSTPTHSSMRYLYKYPQAAYPYDKLVLTNRQRTRTEPEYELIDTGVFDGDRYFDVFVDFAKKSPEDILFQITVANRGPEPAELHLLPQFWFRDTWSANPGSVKPELRAQRGTGDVTALAVDHPELGKYLVFCEGQVPLLFTENESNLERLYGQPNRQPYVKDAFDQYLVHGRTGAVNPEQRGTKAAAHHRLVVPARGEVSVALRLVPANAAVDAPFGRDFKETFALRKEEADAFYASIMPPRSNEDERRVVRQAMAGMLWSKQYYYFDLDKWLEEHGHAPHRGRSHPSSGMRRGCTW
jgi:hypothetical protein